MIKLEDMIKTINLLERGQYTPQYIYGTKSQIDRWKEIYQKAPEHIHWADFK